MSKPLYIGQAVLDQSKWVMCHLRYVKLPQFEADLDVRICTLAGDTDSFFLTVEAEAGRHDVVQQELFPSIVGRGLLDTSNYPRDHPLFSNALKARLGCVNDESGGDAFQE